MLPGATEVQIGALGEETASVLLTENFRATAGLDGMPGCRVTGTARTMTYSGVIGISPAGGQPSKIAVTTRSARGDSFKSATHAVQVGAV